MIIKTIFETEPVTVTMYPLKNGRCVQVGVRSNETRKEGSKDTPIELVITLNHTEFMQICVLLRGLVECRKDAKCGDNYTTDKEYPRAPTRTLFLLQCGAIIGAGYIDKPNREIDLFIGIKDTISLIITDDFDEFLSKLLLVNNLHYSEELGEIITVNNKHN